MPSEGIEDAGEEPREALTEAFENDAPLDADAPEKKFFIPLGALPMASRMPFILL
jgi:hypothetical protein